MAHSPLQGMFSQRQLEPQRRGCLRRGCILPLLWPRMPGPPAHRQGGRWGARSPRTSGEGPAGRVRRQQKLSWGTSQRSPLLSVVSPRMTERRRVTRAGLSKVKFVRNGTEKSLFKRLLLGSGECFRLIHGDCILSVRNTQVGLLFSETKPNKESQVTRGSVS